jgi:hypothetical protein
MALELHSNDNAREAMPGIWIFSGRSVVLLVIGVGTAIALFRILAACDLDWWVAIPLSLLPLALLTLFVWLIRGKPPSWASDVLAFALWRFRCRLYLNGALSTPPELWVRGGKLKHPKEF